MDDDVVGDEVVELVDAQVVDVLVGRVELLDGDDLVPIDIRSREDLEPVQERPRRLRIHTELLDLRGDLPDPASAGVATPLVVRGELRAAGSMPLHTDPG